MDRQSSSSSSTDHHDQKPYLDLSESINLEDLLPSMSNHAPSHDDQVTPGMTPSRLVEPRERLKIFEQDSTMDWPMDADGSPVPFVEVTMVHGGAGGGGAIVLKHVDGRFLAAASGAGGPSGAMIQSLRIDYPTVTFIDKPVQLVIQVGRGGRAGYNTNVIIDDAGQLTIPCQSLSSGRYGTPSRVLLTGCPKPVMLFGPTWSIHDKEKLVQNHASIVEKVTMHGPSYCIRAGHVHDLAKGHQFEHHGVDDYQEIVKTSSQMMVNRAYYLKQIRDHVVRTTPYEASQTTLTGDQKQPHLKGHVDHQVTMHSHINTVRLIQTHEHHRALSIDGILGGHGTVSWMEQTRLSKPMPAQQQHPWSNLRPYAQSSFHQYVGYAMPVEECMEQQCQLSTLQATDDLVDDNPLAYEVALTQLNDKCKHACWTYGGAAGMGHAVHYPCVAKMVGQGGTGGYSPKPGVTVDPTSGHHGIVLVRIPE